MGRVAGGRNTTIEELPYQVSMEENGEHFCGGSIITPRHVLTAGHCFIGYVSVTSVPTISDRLTQFINSEATIPM